MVTFGGNTLPALPFFEFGDQFVHQGFLKATLRAVGIGSRFDRYFTVLGGTRRARKHLMNHYFVRALFQCRRLCIPLLGLFDVFPLVLTMP